MRIEDDDLLALVRQRACEVCGRAGPSDPHHILKRGLGGGHRLDVAYNLVALCRGWHRGAWKSCHQDAEDGKITKAALLAIVAAREGVAAEAVEAELWRLWRTPK